MGMRIRTPPLAQRRSYGELGAEVGTSGRVVGNAMAANPVCLALPCHRVIRGDGASHGYAYGNDRKCWLLKHEANVRTPSGPADPLGA
jgi:O-6-methylguanine DNA methyltransferase